MSFLCLFAFCFAGEPAQPDPPQQLPITDSLINVEVTTETSPTNARGLQIVSVRVKMQPTQQIYAYAQPIEELVPSYLKLEVSTRDPKTKIDVLYPKGREIKDGASTWFVYENEIAIQAIIQRAPSDRSPVQGRLEFRTIAYF
jgi:hypothetical protein